MEIDKIGAHSLGSGQKRITLTFGKIKDQNPKTVINGLKLNDNQVADIAKRLETEIERQPTKDWQYRQYRFYLRKIRNTKERDYWKGKKAKKLVEQGNQGS